MHARGLMLQFALSAGASDCFEAAERSINERHNDDRGRKQRAGVEGNKNAHGQGKVRRCCSPVESVKESTVHILSRPTATEESQSIHTTTATKLMAEYSALLLIDSMVRTTRSFNEKCPIGQVPL